MGTAHSDASQGKCLQPFIPLTPSVSFVFAILKMLYLCVFFHILFSPCSSVHTSRFSSLTLRGPAVVAAGCAALKQ